MLLENIERHVTTLEKIGNLGPRREDGFLRASWSDEESAAIDYIKQAGEAHGLQGQFDSVGNLYLSTPGTGTEIIQIGSHLDTVPRGGNYDGAAGTLAGLEAILALKDQWSTFARRFELVVWRGEESATFGAVCKGSRAAFGLNDSTILQNKFNGQTLQDAIISQGFDPTSIQTEQPALTQAHIDSIAAHLELHIEQARKLEIAQKPIGITTSIRGTIRCRVTITGQAAHSGGTPMGVAHRQDSNLAMAYMHVEMDQLGQQVLAEGADLVQTVGVINADRDYNVQHPSVYENALTKVSPNAYFTTDVRSNNLAFLESYMAKLEGIFKEVGQRFNVTVHVERIIFLLPTEEIDPQLQHILIRSCEMIGVEYEMMLSGALHDAAVVATQTHSDGTPIPAGLIFIPCKGGISHNPLEYTSPEAIAVGALMLVEALRKLGNY